MNKLKTKIFLPRRDCNKAKGLRVVFLLICATLFLSFPPFSFAQEPAEIVINEFLPNPAGADKDREWIELKNLGAGNINLKGWKIEDASGKKYIFQEEIIFSGRYLVLEASETKIAINNNGETLSLFSPDGQLIFKISYAGKAEEGYSFSRFGENNWRWTAASTPGKENYFPNSLNQNLNNNGLDEIKTEKEITNEESGNNIGTEKNTSASLQNQPRQKADEDFLKGFSQSKGLIGIVILTGLALGISGAFFAGKFLK